jgi:uncharacterized repeat protein (TIGR02543 family)
VPVDAQTYHQGATVTLLGNTGSLARTGYSFAGWNTRADGGGTTYAASSTCAMGTANLTFYAQWTANAAGALGYAYVADVQGGGAGTISQYTIGSNGALTPMTPPTVPTGGNDSRYLAVDPSGKYVYVSNVVSNTVGQFTIGTDGTLTAMSTPTVVMGDTSGGKLYYPCGLAVSPTSQRVYVSLDQSSGVNQFSYGANGALSPLTPAKVTSGDPNNGRNGPDAVAIDPTGTWAYVVNGGANTISQYRIGTDGTLSPLTPFLVASGGVNGSGSAFDVQIASIASGEYLYATNYFDGTVGQFRIDTATGQLSPLSPAMVTAGTYALTLAVHPTGKFAYVAILTATANAVIAQYTINPSTGALTPMTPATVSAGGAGVAAIAVEATGHYAYATSGDTGWGSYSVAQFTIDQATGALTLMSTPTVAAGYGPSGIVTFMK